MHASCAMQHVSLNESNLNQMFGSGEALLCFDALQFDDYSEVVADRFDREKKAEQRREVFPADSEKAYQMGVRFATAPGGSFFVRMSPAACL